MTNSNTAAADPEQDERFLASDGFDFAPSTRVIYGPGRLSRLGEIVRGLGGKTALVCTDSGVRNAGHLDRAVTALKAAEIEPVIFDDIHPNPSTDDVDRGVEVARSAKIDVIVGLGGGSSMDCAKGVNFILSNGGRMQDYWGVGKAKLPMLPLIAVPTTAGTGSEAQSFALISDAKTHQKMACGDKKAACKVAILDPELSISMPASVSTATGIDALAHAVETYVTKPRNIISSLFSRKAWQLLSANFVRVLTHPDDLEARGGMLLGAHFAGAAIENSMLGATHALANPVTAHYGTTHGVIIGVMLPHVIRYNGERVGDRYADLATDVGLHFENENDAAEKLAGFLSATVEKASSATSLTACGVKPESIPQMATEAAGQWTANFNPREVDAESLEEIYRCAL
ncbi:iron-containing alcohol dehydrogenase [Calycomorphotria hydatis]|uniref:Alcohol dehydrogenase 2 n=1 Tax=Calycomorphotria hydatis TaxID=2528027 RepID=A0A517T527_9PLAN|nr:iron-containing alcohol dehydrogenase [Calycomorphotria hydatis]QDT63483.1 Alcohol dehydrogenase 2 [Calycomorphotria hydatis]